MKGDWLKALKSLAAVEFTEDYYNRWRDMVGEMMPIYLEHLPEGSKVLECCCGVGNTAIPMSHHYRVTAFDRDSGILEYARKNATRFGGDINLVKAEFRDIVDVFGDGGFDACSSTGVLEYFTADEIRGLLEKQLSVAPLVCIFVSLGGGRETTDEYGITRYNYSRHQWIYEILGDHDIVEHRKLVNCPVFSGVDERPGFFAVVT